MNNNTLPVLQATDPELPYTLGQFVAEFLAAKRLETSAGERTKITLRDYEQELRKLLKFFPEDRAAGTLGPRDFTAYARHLIEGRKLGRHSRRRVTAYVKAAFRWGAANALFPPVAFGTTFKSPNTTPEAVRQERIRSGRVDYSKRILTGAEIDKLLKLSRPNFKAMILLGVNCGLGPADLGRLRWSDLDRRTGELNMPRGKTGVERRSFMWHMTRKALARVATLKHTRAARKKQGPTALVFITRMREPYYREWEVGGQVRVDNAVSGTFGRMARLLGLKGVTFYRLRHTLKTLGKKARDRDALALVMGHAERSVGRIYDHEEVSLKRLKRLARAVYRLLWPRVQ